MVPLGGESVEGKGTSAQTGKALILVVERDPHIRALEQYFLEKAGFVVEFCGDGALGLERSKLLMPDILIAEILVPGLDGLAVCRALKSDPATRHIIVVIFSILAAEDRARAAGADACLRKPLDDTALIASVEALLSRRANEGRPSMCR